MTSIEMYILYEDNYSIRDYKTLISEIESKSEEEVKEIIDGVIDEIINSNEIEKIYNQYIFDKIEPDSKEVSKIKSLTIGEDWDRKKDGPIEKNYSPIDSFKKTIDNLKFMGILKDIPESDLEELYNIEVKIFHCLYIDVDEEYEKLEYFSKNQNLVLSDCVIPHFLILKENLL